MGRVSFSIPRILPGGGVRVPRHRKLLEFHLVFPCKFKRQGRVLTEELPDGQLFACNGCGRTPSAAHLPLSLARSWTF